jgi:hypothetical protein
MNFFDKNFAQNIVGGLVVLVITLLLSRNSSTTNTNGRGWKILNIIAWLMIVGGFVLLSQGVQNGGFENVKTGAGLSLALLGWIVLGLGKFIGWWQR